MPPAESSCIGLLTLFLIQVRLLNGLRSCLNSLIRFTTKVRLVKAMVFQWSCMDVRVGLLRKLSAKELMLLNCGIGEDS